MWHRLRKTTKLLQKWDPLARSRGSSAAQWSSTLMEGSSWAKVPCIRLSPWWSLVHFRIRTSSGLHSLGRNTRSASSQPASQVPWNSWKVHPCKCRKETDGFLLRSRRNPAWGCLVTNSRVCLVLSVFRHLTRTMQFQSVSVCLSSLSPCKRNGFESRKFTGPHFLRETVPKKHAYFLRPACPLTR